MCIGRRDDLARQNNISYVNMSHNLSYIIFWTQGPPFTAFVACGKAKGMKRALILAILIVMVSAAMAMPPGGFDVIGLATESCGKWTAVRRDHASAWGYEQWFLGFITGVDYMGHANGLQPMRGTDAAGILAWADNYCREHPLNLIVQAADAFIIAHPHE